MSPKTGRPTDNPKPYKKTVRIDEESKDILDKYCIKYNVNENEAIRHGIKKLVADLNEKE